MGITLCLHHATRRKIDFSNTAISVIPTMGRMWNAFVLCVAAGVVSLVAKMMKKNKLPIIIDGTVEPGFEEVLETFRASFESGDVEPREGGSAFAAYYKGKQVVNIWGGYADYESSQPWRHDTMAIVFSTTKGMSALCMAMLVDRGHLDYDQKVVHYWPEFGQNGKENITVRQLLHHEGGLAFIDTLITLDLLMNYDELGEALAKSPPIWKPGTTHGYHGFTLGLYASQLLTRADPQKRTIGEYFRDEIAKPFGIEFYIGLPKELNYRVARYFTDKLNNWDALRRFLISMMNQKNRELTMTMMFGTNKSLISKMMENTGNVSDWYIFNDPRNREIECPSATGIGTAEALAKVYGIIANGGKTTDGKRLLSEKLIKMIQEDGTPRIKDEVLGLETKFSLGFSRHIYQDREMIGHAGYGGNNAQADIQQHVGVGFVTRYASPYLQGNDPRFTSVRDALYRAIQTLER
ncbi:beta-lactamase domain-containing protein 2-like [Amphiura filiformis]|uniref:beta-lactamase domain-containing protein 2-like n=1 Tax=Amphiura filiformis TaxID=82378 RepID=UPI003B222066